MVNSIMMTGPYSQHLLNMLSQHPSGLSLEDLLQSLAEPRPSVRTLQRRLKELVESEHVKQVGKGKSTRYVLQSSSVRAKDPSARPEASYESYIPISEEAREIQSYVRQATGARKLVAYDRQFLEAYEPNVTQYLDDSLTKHLQRIGDTGNANQPIGTYGRAILDRLLIDLSWSSSRLEGNTYSRLDTQLLIESGKEAEGKAAEETQMILNHKRAIEFLLESSDDIGFNRYTFLNLHGLLSENLMPDPSASGCLRLREVNIAGTVYQPTAIPQVLEESFLLILEKASAIENPFEQAFFVMVHLPYLQAFEDVNKRVSRIGANIAFIKHNLCPLTFLDVPEQAYVEGFLGVYELGRIDLLKNIFVWAYERSTQKYLQVKKTLIEPDPMRLKYRSESHALIGDIVRACRQPYRLHVEEFARNNIPENDKKIFIEMVLNDIERLNEGVLARYKIRPSEFSAWEKMLLKY